VDGIQEVFKRCIVESSSTEWVIQEGLSTDQQQNGHCSIRNKKATIISETQTTTEIGSGTDGKASLTIETMTTRSPIAISILKQLMAGGNNAHIRRKTLPIYQIRQSRTVLL
jgi:hypothetical protein